MPSQSRRTARAKANGLSAPVWPPAPAPSRTSPSTPARSPARRGAARRRRARPGSPSPSALDHRRGGADAGDHELDAVAQDARDRGQPPVGAVHDEVRAERRRRLSRRAGPLPGFEPATRPARPRRGSWRSERPTRRRGTPRRRAPGPTRSASEPRRAGGQSRQQDGVRLPAIPVDDGVRVRPQRRTELRALRVRHGVSAPIVTASFGIPRTSAASCSLKRWTVVHAVPSPRRRAASMKDHRPGRTLPSSVVLRIGATSPSARPGAHATTSAGARCMFSAR